MDFAAYEERFKNRLWCDDKLCRQEYGTGLINKVKIKYPEFRENANLDGKVGYYFFGKRNQVWYNAVVNDYLADTWDEWKDGAMRIQQRKLDKYTRTPFSSVLKDMFIHIVDIEDIPEFFNEMFDVFYITDEIFTELKNQIVEENLHYSSNNYENYLQKTYLVLDLIKEYEETHKDLVDSDPSSETITEKHAVSYKGVKYPQNLTKESVDVQKKSAKIGEERETMPKSGHRIRGHPEIRAA